MCKFKPKNPPKTRQRLKVPLKPSNSEFYILPPPPQPPCSYLSNSEVLKLIQIFEILIDCLQFWNGPRPIFKRLGCAGLPGAVLRDANYTDKWLGVISSIMFIQIAIKHILNQINIKLNKSSI